jgi:HTH-type transcriptional regulator/antitoxin HipB
VRVRSVRELGAAVREYRDELGWSQHFLAERAGVSREWLVRFEGGKPGVRLDRAFDLITALNLTVELAPREASDGSNPEPAGEGV